ncbi:MAG: PD-(D/E)XK nuclease family transposase, partial [Bacteroidales bacterium]|nr:PD-(D/E)XK nuclease family transposase [Bacteroidales bacterium]
TGEIMTDVLRFVFLELGRFRKHLWELETVSDKWMYLLKHMHEMVEIPEQFSDPLIQRLFILSKIGNFTAEELKQYEDSMKDMSDYYNIIDTAAEEAEKRGLAKGMEIGREEGRLEGRLEGRKEGEAKAKAELVRKMIDAGMNPEQIGQITGLDISEIQAMA